MAIWLAIRDSKRSLYVIGSGVNSGIGFGGKFLIALELLAGRVVVESEHGGPPSGWVP